jgi:AcrR family transcriptional regulator
MVSRKLSARQAQIVEVAIRILATEGARRFTAQRLATEIGVTTGAIFRHFESMKAIIEAVIDAMEALLFEGLPPSNEESLERLERFFLHRTAVIRAHPHLARLLLSDCLAQVGVAAQVERLDEFKRRTQLCVRDCLLEAHRGGLLAEQVSPRAAALLVIGGIFSLSHAGARVSGDVDAERLADEVWAALERVLRAPRAPAPAPRRHARQRQKKDTTP